MTEDLTGHSVRPELVVMDVAEEHESYEANDVGPVEDLQKPATLLTPRLQGAHCAVSGWAPVCHSYIAPTAISVSTPPQSHNTCRHGCPRRFFPAHSLVKTLPLGNDDEPRLVSRQDILALDCMRSQPDMAHLKVIAANV